MGFSFKKLIGGEDEPGIDDGLDEGENYGEETSKPYNSEKTIKLLEPRAYSESQQIADYLKKKTSVIVNLKRVTPDQGKRIVDFLSGTLYAIGGELQKLGNGIFLCTPNNIMVEGKMSEENASKMKMSNLLSYLMYNAELASALFGDK